MPDSNDKMFQTVFNNSPVGLVLVNKDTTLRDANAYMFNTFKLKLSDVQDQKFGNVFHCVAVTEPGETCGQMPPCKDCGLRNGVTAVLEKDIEIPETEMDHNFVIQGVEQKKWFKISASRVNLNHDIFAIVSFSDITTQKEYEALLNYQLTLDMATGITNKHTLINTLRSLDTGFDSLTVAIIDFDDFKSINDQYGHLVGDRVLSIFCTVASANTRRQDILGRFGGEEFMLIFPGAYAALMIKVLKRISQQLKLECEAALGFVPTFSAGLAEFSRQQLKELSVQDIISQVDTSMYQAKKQGKNMIVIDEVGILL